MAIEQQKTKNFIEELAGDLHVASNEARTRQVEAIIDLFPTYSFYLLRINGKQVKKVDAPKGVTLNSNYTNQRVVFYTDGQVAQAGTIKITDQRGKIHSIVIQLSSGRFWIKFG
ncbi:GspH/FimT family protein [Ammoniphilus sp. YIM 78166]|uniref:GspH/FimT family protein n=1 Tax=Ammoniphilus sp. YIM 78166 TaxID=1644106 RepID=UPI001430F69D|nr:GspH/FimT family protein [Ammoniphilus sp. YIM 78166]